MEQYKQEFIEFMIDCQALKFGDFTLKSGRKSPFFMNAGAYVTGEQLPQLIMDIAESQEYNELQKLIVGYVNENAALFALGDKPMEEWDSYVEELNRMGLDRYIELAQEAYDALQG